MKPVFQKQNGDCVVAVVASLSELPWSTVKKVAGSTRHGLDRTHTRKLMRSFGLVHSYYASEKGESAQSWAEAHPYESALLIIRPPCCGPDHAVAVHKGIVHDPLKNPLPKESVVVEVYKVTSRE